MHTLGMPFIVADDMASAEPLPGWKGRFFHSENMTFAVYEVDAEAVPIHDHSHPQEEVWNVIDGERLPLPGQAQKA